MKLKYTNYLYKTLQIFISCLLLGSLVNQSFHRYQKSLKNPNVLLISFLQLITIISLSYLIYVSDYFNSYFESYSPNLILSTFLFSLQSNIFNNFNLILSNNI